MLSPDHDTPAVIDLGSELVEDVYMDHPARWELPFIDRDAAAITLDSLLFKLSRGRALVDRRVCGLLAALERCDGFRKLGFVRAGDYGRERLGVSDRYARELTRTGRLLEELSLISRALEEGRVSVSKVQACVAVVETGTQSGWLAFMERSSVRKIKERVREIRAGTAGTPGAQGETEEPGMVGAPDVTGRRGMVGAPGVTGGPGMVGEQGETGIVGAQCVTGLGDAQGETGETGSVGAPGVTGNTGQVGHEGQGKQEWSDAARSSASWQGPDGPLFDISFQAPAWFRGKWRSMLEMVRKSQGVNIPDGVALQWALSELVSTALPASSDENERLQDDGGASTEVEQQAESWRMMGEVRAALEACTDDWVFLCKEVPRVSLAGWTDARPADPHEIDAVLRRLMRLYNTIDFHIGRLAHIQQKLRLMYRMQFYGQGHYASERLGMSPRTLRDRVFLDRMFFEMPELEEAFKGGEIGVSAALIVARVASSHTVVEWLERARGVTLQELEAQWRNVDDSDRRGAPPPRPDVTGQEAAEGEPDEARSESGQQDGRQMFSDASRDESEITISCKVAQEGLQLWGIARRILGQDLEDWEVMEAACDVFFHFWEVRHEDTALRRVLERDGYVCSVPGCRARNNLTAHHVVFRSQGGGDEDENLSAICFAHHLEGIHDGRIRVSGQAPDRLVWELGLKEGAALVSYRGSCVIQA